MTPVISPMWFYLIQICDVLGDLSIFVLVISFLFGCIISIVAIINEYKHAKICVIVTLIGIIISSLILIFLPSKETLVAMKASEFVTPSNLEAAKIALLDMVSQIASMIK